MMNRYLIWLATEYKRAVLLLPRVMLRAVCLAAVCLAAGGFCAIIAGGKDAEPKLRIGYTVTDNALTDMAVSYVQEMASVKSLCSLEPVTEQEGRARLGEGSLSALIVLPADVMNEIISGSNAPAVLYMPEKDENAFSGGGLGAVGGMLFEELASAGIGMLGTAQAEVYASYMVLRELGNNDVDGDLLQTVYDDINKFNLAAVGSRENLFRTKRLLVTENDTYAVYFGSAFLTVYVLLAGLFFGDFCVRGDLWQRIADRRLGVGYAAQLFSKCLAGSMLMLAVTLFPVASYAILMCALPRLRAVLPLEMTLAGASGIALVIAFMTVYNMMVYQMAGKRTSAVVSFGVPALLQAYMSGCIIPSVLLPKAVAKAGQFVPASFVKKCFTAFLTGGTKDLAGAAVGLAAWGVVMFATTVVFMHMGVCEASFGRTRPVRHSVKMCVGNVPIPSVVGVLFRRMMHSRSIWVFMAFFAAASALIMRAESRSRTSIAAAVYDESGEYAKLLENYDGLVSFQLCDDKDQVMDAVLRGNAECGYVLPKNLADDMVAHRAGGSVTVYQDEDAVAVPVVNEVLFERVFRKVSLEWYCDYISRLRSGGVSLRDTAREYFERELSGGTTFRFEIKRLGTAPTETDREKNVIYPLHAASVAVVALCAIQGAAQAASDIRERRFYKQNRAAMAALTVGLPVMLGILAVAVVCVFFSL